MRPKKSNITIIHIFLFKEKKKRKKIKKERKIPEKRISFSHIINSKFKHLIITSMWKNVFRIVSITKIENNFSAIYCFFFIRGKIFCPPILKSDKKRNNI